MKVIRIKNRKLTIPAIVFSVIIVVVSWSLIEGWFPFAQRKWLFLALGMGYAMFIRNNFYLSFRFIWLVAYILVVFLNMVLEDKFFRDVGTVGFEFFVLGFPATMASYLLPTRNRTDMGFVLMSFFIVLLFSTIASFLIDTFLLPNAIRMMTRYSITLKDMSTVYAYYRIGLSSYAFPHALPVLIPPVVMGIKNRSLSKWIRVLCWVALICLILIIYLSGIMTALLLSIIGLLMAIVTKAGEMRHNIIRFAVIGILAIPFLTPAIMGPLLHEAKMAVGEDSYYYNKIESFEMSFTSDSEEENEEGDWEERKDLYSRSVNGIIENILVGTNQKVGGHSSFLDRLASLGLVGFIPFFVFLILQLFYPNRFIPKKSRIYYYEGVLMGLLMLALKSSFRPETTIVLLSVLPIAVYYLSYEKIQKRGKKVALRHTEF